MNHETLGLDPSMTTHFFFAYASLYFHDKLFMIGKVKLGDRPKAVTLAYDFLAKRLDFIEDPDPLV